MPPTPTDPHESDGLADMAGLDIPHLDATYLARLKAEMPGLRVVRKDQSPFSRLLDALLRVLTLGGQSAFVSRYATTIGRTIYLPADWDRRSATARYITLRHEAVHLRQFRDLGLPWMTFVYLLPILPLGLALGRARIEQAAYEETIRATVELLGVEAAAALRPRIVAQFTSAAYGWMWPFPRAVGRWFDRTLERVCAELEADAAA